MTPRYAKTLKIAAATIALIAAALVIWVYSNFDPAAHGWFPRCPFLVATGLKCPGCGSQRALHALLHADIAGVWRANALIVFAVPLAALLIYAELRRRRHPRLHNFLSSQPVIIATAALIIGWWILRNLL